MRVLVCLASPYPAPRGSQLLVRQVEQGLRRRGHEVAVVSYGGWLRDHTGLHLARPFLDLLTLMRVLWIGRRWRPDVLHAHNYEAGVIALLAATVLRRPVVFHGHALMRDELPSYARHRVVGRLLAHVGAWFDRTIPRLASRCIAVTPDLGRALRALGAKEVTVLRPVHDPEELRALGPCDPPSATPTVLYAGNLDGYQNLDLLLAAFAVVRRAIPTARLSIVTHAPHGGEAMEAHPNVDVSRVATVAEAWRLVGRAWVAVVPRMDPCGHPMKVLNYMAAGKAIVTTATAAQGLRDDVTAVVVERPTPNDIATAITDLLRDEGRRDRLGRAAQREVMATSAWEASMAALEDVYRCVSKRGTVRARNAVPGRI